jgi:Stage II sporulation protein E (SpoIIE)
MSQDGIAVEWYISENITDVSSRRLQLPVRMGPFASEEECRELLTSLNQIPRFPPGKLGIHKRSKEREMRIRIEVPVEVCRLSTPETFWPAYTVDVSSLGARLAGLGERVKTGEVLEIRCDQRKAVFRVVWVGLPGTRIEGQTGVECLSPEINIWDLDWSERTYDEPLLQEIAVARTVQGNLLPRNQPPLHTLDYSANCIQARTVGGDYYDFLDMGPGQVGFVLADVAGKGVGAALLMASLQGSIHSRAAFHPGDLPQRLAAVNQHLYHHTAAERYATLFFGHYDDATRSLRYVNCGHNPPLLLRGEGSVERLAPTATVLGLFRTWECSVGETRLESGDLLTVFTDGIVEARCENGEEFGETRLLGTLHESRELDAVAILRNVEQAVEQFRFGEREDDLTLVIARAQ